MSKQDVLVEALDTETQFLWTASGDSIVGESADLWCAYTGQREEEMQDWGWIEALHPDDRERARKLWWKAVEHKRFYETWYCIRNAGGVFHTFMLRCLPLLHKDGSLKGWVSQFASMPTECTLPEANFWQTNQLQHLFAEQTSIGMIYISVDGRYLQVNEKFCSMLGYSREELLGRNTDEVTHPEDVEISHALLTQRLPGSTGVATFEKRYIRKDGSTIWTRITGMLLRQSSSKPLYVFSLIEDITEQKQEEEAQKRLLEYECAKLQEKQVLAAVLVDQLKAVFEAMTDGVTFCDVEGKMLLINAAGRRLLELGSEIDLTDEPYQNIASLYKIYDEHGQLLVLEQLPLSRILRGEVLSSEHAMDVIIRLPSGREVQYSFSGAPVYDQRGQMIGGVCVYRDMTEVRQKERRVQQALNALLTIVEEVSRLPMQVDEPSEAVPIPSLTTVGHTLAEIIRQILQCHYAACIALDPQTAKLHLLGVNGLTVEEEQIYRRDVEQSFLSDYIEEEDMARLRTNEVLILDLVTRPYVRPHSDFGVRYRMVAPMLLDGQLVGLLIVGQIGADLIYTQEEIALVKAIAKLVLQIIERARLTKEWTVAQANELALREANRRFDAFLSIASHELRTPLTTIKGNVQLALRRMEPLKSLCCQQFAETEASTQIMQALERVHFPLTQASHRTRVQERMIADLLDASRIRANKLELLMRPCDLAQIVRQMIEDLHYFASDRVVHLHLPAQMQVPLVADADRIGQVVNNYLVNALRYSSSDRPVEISLELIEEGKMARVAVRDQGVGIAHQDLRHIWERFYRSHATEMQYQTGAGLGLGLYISRTIIERHGGHVGVESVQGKGSTFWFTLPLTVPGEMC